MCEDMSDFVGGSQQRSEGEKALGGSLSGLGVLRAGSSADELGKEEAKVVGRSQSKDMKERENIIRRSRETMTNARKEKGKLE